MRRHVRNPGDATLTSKGQLTLPIQLRREMGLDAGDRVRFIRERERVYLVPLPREDASDLIGILRSEVDGPIGSFAEERAAARRAIAGAWERKDASRRRRRDGS